MKKNLFKKLILALLVCIGNISFAQIIYQHDFGTATFTAVNPYGVAPSTIDANLSASQWQTSYVSGYNSSAGSAGQALSLTSSLGTPTYSLTFTVASGFNCDITAFSFWRQRSAAGAQNWTLTVNGVTTIGTGTVPTIGVSTGTLGVSSTANGLSGVVNVVLQLSGATGAGTFRLDDFTLYGSVYPASTCTPPTIQASSISSSSLTNTSANLSWTAGNGGNVIVVAHQSSPVNAFPASGSSYTANSYFGSGQDLGGGNYIVYNGTGTSVNLTGLFSGSTYYFAIMEYNTTSGNCYLFPATTGNLTTTGTLANCLDIESILVDACVPGGGCTSVASPNCNCEGKNEMVRFKVGPAPINVSDISINWPSNAYLGIETNTTITTPLINALNSAITACGYLKQPIGGILPAGKDVLLMTSTDFCTTANSFANLNDTLLLIFQVAGNFAGHFGNTTNGGAVSGTPTGSVSLRTLSITQISTGCVESVDYERSLLVNIFGTYNGTTAQNDGSAVDYDDAGNPTYVNRGCVAPFIPFQVDAGINENVCFNSSAVLTATTANFYTSIAWSGGTGTFSSPSALTTSYTPGAAETGTVMLYCSMTQSCSATLGTTKDSVMLTILQLPLATVSASNGYSLCPSATSVMSYSITNPAFAGMVNSTWSTPTSTNPTYTVSSPSGTTSVTYTVNLTNACGSTPQTFTVYPLTMPTVTLSSTTPTACAGNTLSLSASSNTGNYSWNNPLSINSVVVISSNTTTTGVVTTTNSCGSANDTYTLTITPIPTLTVDNSNISLCTGQSATITATSSEGTYLWLPGSTTTNTLVVNSPGNYTVSTSNNCFTTTATTSVTINSFPTLSISATSSSLCATGQTATLSLSGSTGTYNWSNGSGNVPSIVVNTPGVYTATVTTASCGFTVTSFTIDAILTPTISLSSSSSLLCNGATATLTASSNMSNEVWSNGSINTSTIIVGSAGTYTVGVSNACGSPIDTVTIQANTTPTLVLTPSSVVICPNETATLTVTGGSAPYSWSNSSNTGSVVTTNGGTVTVSNTNACGTSSETVVVTVVNLNASISANPMSGITPVSVDFTNNSVGANTYLWNFGNGQSANTQTVSSQTYSVVGAYTVYLLITNGSCSDIDSLTINVLNQEGTMIIPNVFTPNGDSINDIFRITGFNIVDLNCSIFDRWGLLMYSWDGIKNGWNGKVKDKYVPDGTYFYMINAKDIDNKEIKKQGYLQLFK